MRKDAEKAWGEVFSDGVREGTDKVREGIGLDPKPGAEEPSSEPTSPDASTSADGNPRYDKPWVTEVQLHLAGLGYQPGPVDGAYGLATKQALEAFQRDRGLQVTGLPTPAAMAALRGAKGGQQPQQAAAPTSPKQWSKATSSGNAEQPSASPAAGTATASPVELTLESQDRLNQLGYDAGPVDGQHGGRTAAAIKAFQRDHGLPIDGRVTPSLVSALRTARPAQAIAGGGTPIFQASAGGGAGPDPRLEPTRSATAQDFAGSPTPDYLSLLKLFIAANADLLQNDAFAWEHHLVFDISSGDPAEVRKRCSDLSKRASNEITRLSLLDEARKSLQASLPSLAKGPKTAVYLLRADRTLRNYDLEQKAFPLSDDRHTSTIDGRASLGVSRSSYGKKGTPTAEKASLCSVGYFDRSEFGKQLDGIQFVPGSFHLKVEGGDKIARLPMPVAEAESYLNQNGREVAVEALVEVGPLIYGSGSESMPARILAARLLEPKSGRLLHTYEPSLFTPQGDVKPVDDPGSGGPAPAPISMFSLGLVAIGGQPELAEDAEQLVAFAAHQVRVEQQIWEHIDNFRERAAAHPQFLKGLHPSQPVHIFEWKTLSDQSSALARGPLLDLFARPEPDWSFLEQEPWWDPRFQVVKQALIFPRDSVQDRDPGFAARELLPVFRSHLLAVAERAPKRLVFTQSLPAMELEYDFDAQALRLPEKQGRPYELLRRVSRPIFEEPANISSTAQVLPPAVRSTIPYVVSGLGGGGGRKPAKDNGVGIGVRGAPEQWQYGFHHLPHVNVMALDRALVIPRIPMDPATAERIAKARGGKGVEARVTLEVMRTEIGEQVSRRERKPMPVVFARLLGVEIVGPQGETVATLGPEAFESALALAAAKADAEVVKAKAEAEAAAREKAAERSRAEKLAALTPPGDGWNVMITLAGGAPIEQVYTLGGSSAVSYRQTVESKGLDLPLPGKGVTLGDVGEVLQAEPGTAVVLPRSVLERAFPAIEDLDIEMTAFPPSEPSPLDPAAERKLAALMPADAPMLWVRRAADGAIERVYAVGNSSVFARYAVGRMETSRQGVELPEKAEGIGLRQLAAVLKSQSGIAVVMPREHFRNGFARWQDLDLQVTAFPPPKVASTGDPTAGAAKPPAGNTAGDERPADDFKILEITIGMSEEEALAAVTKEFAPEQIAHDPSKSAVFAEKGRCEYRDPEEPAIANEAGSICLALQFADGAVSRIALRQVIAGDVTVQALEAFTGRYGEPVYKNETPTAPEVRRTVLGWGKPVGATRADLGRAAHMAPPMVLEGNLWLARGTTVAVLRLDPAHAPRTAASGSGSDEPKIKF